MATRKFATADSTDELGAMPTTSSASYANRSPLVTGFDRFASGVTRWAGSPRCLLRRDEQDLREVADFYARLSERAKATGARKEMHSIDDEGMPATDPAPPDTGNVKRRS